METAPLNELHWIDISELPPPEPLLGLPLLMAMLVFTLALAVFALRWWQSRPRPHARRQLKRLARLAEQPQQDPRQLTFMLVKTLRQGLQVRQLEQMAIGSKGSAAWFMFCKTLKQACYQPHPPTLQQLLAWIETAQYWLQHLPRRHAR